MNVNVTFGQGDSNFPVKAGATDQSMDVEFGNTQLIKGDKGDDGISPTVDITPIEGGHRISITDADGTETADVMDGVDGKDGATGDKGDKGDPGEKGDKGDPGQPGEKGEKGDKGDPGQPGEKGDPGEDGISPTVAVQDITGGHRVTITDKDGEKTFDVLNGKDGAGGSGDSAAIIDVTSLPETDIREDVFYRTVTAEFYWGGGQWGVADCLAVDTLPEIGEPATNADMTRLVLYYAVDTGEVSAYVTDELAAANGVPAGWYPAEIIIPMAGLGYGGVVSDITEIIDTNIVYLLVENNVKYRNNEKWASVQGLGRQGAGDSSVIFNSALNEANGFSSFSKGYNTKAIGEASSAEGHGTVAVGRAQHVEGIYNVIDEVEDPHDGLGKYVHIVGHGFDEDRRDNIYTLDWSGNGWYAGTVECTGVILTSPSGTRYRLTVADDGTLTTAAV